MEARDGDMMLAPFQCDHCWFINLNGRPDLDNSRSDARLLGYIRRVNLDIMWSREPGTVKNNMYQYNKIRRLSKDLNIEPWTPVLGPWPVEDNMGFRLAITMLRASQEQGRNSKKYVQFETIRKIRSAASSAYENSAQGSNRVLVFRGEKGMSYRLSHAETESHLFVKFIRGLESRMGKLVRSNLALDYRILLIMAQHYEAELADTSVDYWRKRHIIVTFSYFMACFGASLRGNEGLYLEGSSLCDLVHCGNSTIEKSNGLGHISLPLLGRFKNELGEAKHVAVVVNTSTSGLEYRKWIERLVWILIREGKENDAGPAFCRIDGSMMRSYELDAEFHKSLRKVRDGRPDLIPEGLDIENVYGTYRSLRRGSNTRATERAVGRDVIELINRWRKFEHKRGGKPSMSMREHYMEIKLILRRILAYSLAH